MLEVGEDGRLHQMALGHPARLQQLELPTVIFPLAYPTFGEEVLREPALRGGLLGSGLVANRNRAPFFNSTNVLARSFNPGSARSSLAIMASSIFAFIAGPPSTCGRKSMNDINSLSSGMWRM